jgi:hypothetical protein
MLGRFIKRGLYQVDLHTGHAPGRLGVPASAGRTSIAWGPENISSAGFFSNTLNARPLAA